MTPRPYVRRPAARLLAFALFALPIGAAAQGPPADGPATAPDTAAAGAVPVLRAARLVGGRPAVDGRLDEAVWADAPAGGPFVQREPAPGAPSTERTEVRVLYDAAALYVGFRCWVRDPATLVARMARRDQSVVSDRVSVDVASTGDGRTGFSFAVTAAGVKQDYLLFDDVREDAAWDAVFDAAAGRFEGGWTAEFRIPLSQLRYRGGPGPQAWTIQFQRDIPANGEVSFWAPILPDREGYVSRFGRLDGIAGLAAPRRVELLPYAAARLTRAPGDDADPFYDANDLGPAAGFDARVGLSSALTLTATVNPDFGQVEADPAVVNLTAFETFFEERRPFFVEGTDVFAFGATRTNLVNARPTFFYSRRIGRSPQPLDVVHPDTAYAYAAAPEQTTIAAAAKVSGQAGPWSVGVLNAVTTRETARFLREDGGEATAEVEPLANHLVGRARRNWRGGATVAGGFLSAVHRDARGNAFGAFLPAEAYVGGLDVEHAWARRAWTLSGVLAASHVAGDAGAIGLQQRSSRRYYQRPDQDYLTFDPDATTLTGTRAELSLARTGGDPHWRGSLTAELTSPGFEVNDLGFQTRADLAALNLAVGYIEPSPGLFRRLTLLGTSGLGWNLGGDLVNHAYDLTARATLRNLWVVQTTLAARPVYVNDRLTRGGPLALRPADGSLSLRVTSDERRPVFGSVLLQGRRELPHEHAAGREWALGLGGTLAVRPSPAVEFRLLPDWFRAFNTDQFLTARADSVAATTFGRRYVFSDTRLEELILGLRADWTFSPDLSLQLYLAPAVTAVAFTGLKELAAPRTFDFAVYGRDRGTLTPIEGDEGEVLGYRIEPGDGGAAFTIPNLDFTFLSLRGNAVLRWEYRPGSTLFVVWQQTRDEDAAFGGLDVLDAFGDVFRAPVRNVFLVKATYWLGL